MRLIMRAWREQADGARAHAEEWKGRWAHAQADGGGCALAMRTRMTAASSSLWEEEGWRMRVLLEFYRLVQADRILGARAEHARAKRGARCDGAQQQAAAATAAARSGGLAAPPPAQLASRRRGA